MERSSWIPSSCGGTGIAVNEQLDHDETHALDNGLGLSRPETERIRTSIARNRAEPDVARYLSDVSAAAPAAAEDERRAENEQRIVLAAKEGDPRAREELIERFLPAIVRLARSYRTQGLELGDLVQEGCLGLLRALTRYDAERGTPFWPFAEWWVRLSLQELRSDFLRPLRLPPKALAQLSRLKTAHGEFYARERREPTLDELSEQCKLDRKQVEALMRTDRPPRSLVEPVRGEDEGVGLLGELLHDPLSAAAYEEVLDELAGEQLRALFIRLADRERDVLSARLGLDGRDPERLTQVAERLGISAERVRQIEQRALGKLREAA